MSKAYYRGLRCACGEPISDYATMCLSCSARLRNERRWGSNRQRKCSICERLTRNADRICDECAGRNKWDGDPEECPACSGLPWRRGENQHGERIADTCPKCGLPWEPEPVLPIEAHLRGVSNIVERA